MIVIVIVGILMGMALLPYGEYMQRARLSNSVDTISQEWVLAHKQIRNGKEFSETEPNHASVILEFEKWKNFIKKYWYKTETFSDSDASEPDQVGQAKPVDFSKISDSSVTIFDKDISFEQNVEILSLDGTDGTPTRNFTPSANEKIYYVIQPPRATGKFYDQNFSEISEPVKKIIIGYSDAKNAISRAKEILLRPYLQ